MSDFWYRLPAAINVIALAVALLLMWHGARLKRLSLTVTGVFIASFTAGFSLAVMLAGGTFRELLS